MKQSIRIFSAIVFLFSDFSPVLAQISFIPSVLYVKNQEPDTISYDGITILNNSGSVVYLSWRLLSIDTVGGSRFDLCASGMCYPGIPDSGNFSPIDPGQSGWLKMHFLSGKYPGVSMVKILVFEKDETGYPGAGDTLTYILNTGGISGVTGNQMPERLIHVYPNPATNYITITGLPGNGMQVILCDLSGRQWIRETVIGEMILPESMPPGWYVLYLGKKNSFFYSQRIYKSD